MKRILALLAIASLAACSVDASGVVQTDNPNFTVEKLFTIDGCNVYRFGDGESRYVVTCPDGRAAAGGSITHTTSTGNQTQTYTEPTESITVRRPVER